MGFFRKSFYFLIFFVLFSTQSFAANKITPSEVLKTGEFELQAGYSFSSLNGKTSIAGTVYDTNVSSSALQTAFAMGLSDWLEFDVAFPYYFSKTNKKSTSSQTTETKSLGAGDVLLGANIAIFRENAEKGLLAASVAVKPAIASDTEASETQTGGVGTGTTDLILGISGSKETNFELYYSLVYRLAGSKTKSGISQTAGNSLALSLGSEIFASEVTTLDFRFLTTFQFDGVTIYNNQKADVLTYYPEYKIQVSAYSEFFPNLTIIPSIGYTFGGDSRVSVAGTDVIRSSSAQGFDFSLSFYSFFGRKKAAPPPGQKNILWEI